MSLCYRNLSVYDIGKNIGCSTCDELIGNSYCNFHKSTKQTLKQKNKKLEYCKDCIAYHPIDKETKKAQLKRMIYLGYDGQCLKTHVFIGKDSKSCMKGDKIKNV